MRREILIHLHSVLEPHPNVHALWLEGADALGRVDAYSDLDIWLDVDAEYMDAVLELIRTALLELGTLDLTFEEPHPHPDIRQAMFHVVDASPFLIVDLCIQRHGRDIVLDPRADAVKILFDNSNVIRFAENPVDISKKAERLGERFKLKQLWVKKELARANFIEAVANFHVYTLEPLITLLRLEHCPAKAEFGTKHIRHDLPADVVARLESLYAAADLESLEQKHQEATRWFYERLETFD